MLCIWVGLGSRNFCLNCAFQQHAARPLPAQGDSATTGLRRTLGEGRHPRLTDRVLLRGLLQHLRRDPALSARDPGAEAEALSSPLKLLAEAKVRDDGSDLPMVIWDGDEDVTGLQVTMDWKTVWHCHLPMRRQGRSRKGLCLPPRMLLLTLTAAA